MLIDENLPWENYVDALSKKIASGIGTIKHIIVCLLPPCMMYIIMALSNCTFTIAAWYGVTVVITFRDKLQRLQNHAAHVLTNSSYDADASTVYF